MAFKYADPNGYDGNSGAEGSPWQHIAYAVAQLSAGDTLYLRAGTFAGSQNVIDSQTYTVPSGTSTGWGGTFSGAVTVAGYPGDTVIIKPPYNTSAVRFATTPVSYFRVVDVQINMVDQTRLATDNGANAIYLSTGSSYNWFERVEIYNGYGNGAGANTNGGNSSHNVWKNCHFHHIGHPTEVNGAYGFYLNSTDNVMDGCLIHDINGFGIHIYEKFPTAHRNIVRNNTIYRCGMVAGPNAGIVYTQGDDGLIYNNVVYGGLNNCGGIWIYTNTNNIGVYNNTIHGNPGQGILAAYYGATGPTVRNNLLIANGTNYLDAGGVGTVTENTNTIGGVASDYFTSAGTGDFTLITGSVAIDAGADLSGTFMTDILGISRPAMAFDRGAYEFTGSIAVGSDHADDFNRASGGLGAHWTTIMAPLAISSNQVIDTVPSVYHGAFWNAIAYDNDHYSEATITAATNPYPGLGVRMASTGGGRGYGAFIDAGTGDTLIQVFTAGAYAAGVASTSGVSWAVGDVITFEASGSTLTLYQNGVSVLSGSDSTYTTGAAGIMTFANGPSSVSQRALDDWTSGNVVGGGSAVPVIVYHLQQQGMA